MLLLATGLVAGKPPTPVAQLQPGDIEHFLETYPKMVAQLKALGSKYEGLKNPSAMQAALANDEVKSLLERYDWTTESFLAKLTTIASAYGSVRIQAELANLPEDQRAMVASMMGAQMNNLITVHPHDLALVKKHQKQLQAFFDTQ